MFRTLRRLPLQLWCWATTKPITWIESDHVAACRYPRNADQVQTLVDQGVRVLINLHIDPHPAETINRHGLTEVHLPVPDFMPPTQDQIARGVAAIQEAVQRGDRVAVHCGAGLGRTGTLLACYIVAQGLSPDAAIARIRRARPGSIETDGQEAAIAEFAGRIAGPRS